METATVKTASPRKTSAQAAKTEVHVTDNELTLLKAIVEEAKKMGVDPVATAIPCVNPFESKHVGSGTYAAAIRKGLVESQDYGTKDHAVSLTKDGLHASKYRAPH
jgi:hypothetical protein